MWWVIGILAVIVLIAIGVMWSASKDAEDDY